MLLELVNRILILFMLELEKKQLEEMFLLVMEVFGNQMTLVRHGRK